MSFDPETKNKKIPVSDWLKMMGRTRHLCEDKYTDVLNSIQQEVDIRWKRLKTMSEHPEL